jgi:hypothetical protein
MSAEPKPMPIRLHIAEDLSLPLEAVTQTFAILAKRRAGKSFTARRFAEQLHHAGQQVVIVDPKGDWWGIRSSADGKAPGLPFVILGGEHGDVPLEAGAGSVVAKLVVEERVSVLLDLSHLRKSEVARFMGGPMPPRAGEEGFLEVLYRLKAREQYRTPVMLVIDEADAIAPQRPMKGEERMLGAAEDVVRRGGQRGIGCMMVSQRSAVLNKNLLTQLQVLVALRTISPQDLGAIDAWTDVHGTEAERKTLKASLPALPTGDAWFWSPGWPTAEGIFKRVHVLPIKTFDSGATPEPGKKRIEPKNLADIDLETLSRQMSATIERAKADDPRELRKQIVTLQAELRKKGVTAPAPDPDAIERAKAEGYAAGVKDGRADTDIIAEHWERAAALIGQAESVMSSAFTAVISSRNQPKPVLSMPAPAQVVNRPGVGNSPLTIAERKLAAERLKSVGEQISFARVVSREFERSNSGLRRMLIALAQRNGLSARQLGVRAGMSSSSGTFGTYMGKARSEGWITGSRDRLEITEAGRKALGSYDPLPEGRELLAYWLGELGGGAARMLEELVKRYPRAMTAEEVGEAAGMSAASGTFGTYLGKLRTLELVHGGRSDLKASEELFG